MCWYVHVTAWQPQLQHDLMGMTAFCLSVGMMQTQSSTHLAIAKKYTPGLSERFNLFVKDREHSQASESDNSGEGAKDLVSIVEFQVCLSIATMYPAARPICRCYFLFARIQVPGRPLLWA